MDTSRITEGMLLGMGNPLLDISAVVDESLLKKYDLQPDDAIMAEEKHMPLYVELTEKYTTEYIAGGSVQNTLRAVQWILQKPKTCTYFGCVGNDQYANILNDKAIAEGVNVLYQVTSEVPTGTCAVLVTGTNRSLCANLAAAQKFTPDHLEKPECKAAIATAKYFYTSGFFLAVSPDSMLHVAKHSHAKNLTFSLNLSAPFVMEFYKEPLEKLLPYADLIFGNDDEAEAFSKAFNFNTSNTEEIAVKMAALPKLNRDKPRVIVITQGSNSVILVENGKVVLIPVPQLKREEIIDTNGAGDAFTGGFLAQMLLGKPYHECVLSGIYSAGHVIRHVGCTFNGSSEYKTSSSYSY